MGMIAYNICIVEKYSAKSSYNVPVQSQLPGFEENPRTWYELLDERWLNVPIPGTEDANYIRLYRAHQDVRHMKYGYVFGREFYSYLEPNDFRIYFDPGRRIALFNTGKETVYQFINTVNKDPEAQMEFKRMEVDFKRLIPMIPVISGAWFADIDKQFLKSAGFFGSHVDRSEEFKAAAKAGKINLLHFGYNFDGLDMSLAITRHGGVILHNRIGDNKAKIYHEAAEVRLVMEIYDKWLKA
jgi:hypothetical protein